MQIESAGSTGARWFVAIAIGWTWSLGFTAAVLDGAAGRVLHVIALLGPLLAWLGVLLALADGTRRAAFLRRVLDVRSARGAWLMAAVAVGAGLPAGAGGLAALVGGNVGIEAHLTTMSLLGVVAFALAAGIAEEPGWRGIAQDGYEPVVGRLGSALTLGVLWSLWHLPLYFIEGTYQHGLGVGTVEFWGSMVIRVPLAVLLVWLVTSTRGAIIVAVVAHALGNTVGELLATDGTALILELLLTVSAAAAVAMGWARHHRAIASRSGETPHPTERSETTASTGEP